MHVLLYYVLLHTYKYCNNVRTIIYVQVTMSGGQQPSKINYEISKSLRFQDFK